MANRHIDTLLPIAVIVVLSFLVAWGLFKGLESTAAVETGSYKLEGGIAGFVVVFWFLRTWHGRLDARRSEELAIEIARLSAGGIVRDGEDDIAALNTAYNDVYDALKDHFARQDRGWLEVLLRELRTQTIRQARQRYPELREWQPQQAVLDTVIEETAPPEPPDNRPQPTRGRRAARG